MVSSEEVALSRIDTKLTHIETKVDHLTDTVSDIRERLASVESWRGTHTQDHQERVRQERWTTGLLVTVALATVSTFVLILFH